MRSASEKDQLRYNAIPRRPAIAFCGVSLGLPCRRTKDIDFVVIRTISPLRNSQLAARCISNNTFSLYEIDRLKFISEPVIFQTTVDTYLDVNFFRSFNFAIEYSRFPTLVYKYSKRFFIQPTQLYGIRIQQCSFR